MVVGYDLEKRTDTPGSSNNILVDPIRVGIEMEFKDKTRQSLLSESNINKNFHYLMKTIHTFGDEQE
jgi:hypothetical protein